MNKSNGAAIYASLIEENEFPSWFNLWKDGYISIPIKLMIPTSNVLEIDMYEKLLDIIMKTCKEEVFVFNMDGKYVGMDKTYRFYLSEVYITRLVNKNDTFVIGLTVKSKARQTKGAEKIDSYVQQLFLSYDIMCPIIQGL